MLIALTVFLPACQMIEDQTGIVLTPRATLNFQGTVPHYQVYEAVKNDSREIRDDEYTLEVSVTPNNQQQSALTQNFSVSNGKYYGTLNLKPGSYRFALTLRHEVILGTASLITNVNESGNINLPLVPSALNLKLSMPKFVNPGKNFRLNATLGDGLYRIRPGDLKLKLSLSANVAFINSDGEILNFETLASALPGEEVTITVKDLYTNTSASTSAVVQ